LNQEKEPLMSCGADTEANELIASLTTDASFEIPEIDLDATIFKLPGDQTIPMYGQVVPLTNLDLTTGEISGSGSFDALMRGFKAHLALEFEKGRITGAEYAKTYTTLTQNAMAAGVQFLLGRDQAYWTSQLAQLQAITARVQLETMKVQLAQAQFEAQNAKVNYALTKMRLASESVTYCTAKYNLENILPKQLAKLEAETLNAEQQVAIGEYQLTYMLPKQLALVSEQVETQRSQTLDTRTDGATIVGSVGKQKDLYSQQIISYQRDAEVKAAKIFADAWITQKTIDEGLLPPTGFTNASLDDVLDVVKTNNGF
jgi:hypothetical protein